MCRATLFMCDACIWNGNVVALNKPHLDECSVLFKIIFTASIPPYICIISLLTIERRVFFKGRCINRLGKTSFYFPLSTPPQQCEHQLYASEIDLLFRIRKGGTGEEGCREQREGREKKMYVFKLEASLN